MKLLLLDFRARRVNFRKIFFITPNPFFYVPQNRCPMHYHDFFRCFNVVGKLMPLLRWFGKKYGVPLVRVRRRWFWRICLLGSSTLSRELVTWSRSFECRVEKALKNIPLLGTLTRNVWRTRERLKFSTEGTKSHLVYSWRSTKVYSDGRHKEQSNGAWSLSSETKGRLESLKCVTMLMLFAALFR